jgi:hypothetical protein
MGPICGDVNYRTAGCGMSSMTSLGDQIGQRNELTASHVPLDQRVFTSTHLILFHDESSRT